MGIFGKVLGKMKSDFLTAKIMKSNTEKHWDEVLVQKETIEIIKDMEGIIAGTKEQKSCRIRLKSGRALEIREILVYHLEKQGFKASLDLNSDILVSWE